MSVPPANYWQRMIYNLINFPYNHCCVGMYALCMHYSPLSRQFISIPTMQYSAGIRASAYRSNHNKTHLVLSSTACVQCTYKWEMNKCLKCAYKINFRFFPHISYFHVFVMLYSKINQSMKPWLIYVCKWVLVVATSTFPIRLPTFTNAVEYLAAVSRFRRTAWPHYNL